MIEENGFYHSPKDSKKKKNIDRVKKKGIIKLKIFQRGGEL
jgi:hypothetical protein